MKTLKFSALTLLVGILLTGTALSQTKTEETVTTTDSAGSSTVKIVKVASSEDIRDLQNMVMVNPFKFVYLFNASYYRAITPNIAIGATLQAPTVLLENNDASGVGIAGDFLFYPASKVFRGFHLGGNIAYDIISYTGYEPTGGTYGELTEHPFSIGGYMGWNWWPWTEFATEFVIGAEYNFNPTSEAVLSPLGDKKGLAPYASFKIGYAW